eukprot:5674728-Alexandrium_andersonii.AAC.1
MAFDSATSQALAMLWFDVWCRPQSRTSTLAESAQLGFGRCADRAAIANSHRGPSSIRPQTGAVLSAKML